MGHVSLKGPNRLGAAELDDGAWASRAAIAEYAQEDGSRGQAAAEAVLPARRALWRLAEIHMPAALAASLRARLAPSDQTGRGGVRELRRALADWLDPPPLCAACRRPIAAGTDLVACPAKPQRTYTGRGRRPGPTACAPARGPRALRAGAAMARDVARCGTLALFTPLQLDPDCAAAARLLRHGASAYDLVVDRDARTLLEVTSAKPHAHGLERSAGDTFGEADLMGGPVSHSFYPSTHPDVQAARRHFDRVLDKAVRANGPLILKCQLRQYSPNGSTTRADLVQGGAMGCRRALLDYDPAVARFSTYAIHWIRQGGGETFAERDLVAVPDWAAGLRRAVEDRDLLPAQLLRLIGTVAETRNGLLAISKSLHQGGDKAEQRSRIGVANVHDAGLVALRTSLGHNIRAKGMEAARANEVEHADTIARRATVHAEAVAELAAYASLHRAVIEPATKATKGVAAKAAKTLAPAIPVEAVHAALAKAAALPARAKTDTGDEAARVRVAAYVAARLGLRNGAKAVTGGALLTALRSGTAVVVAIGTGEHDDADGGDAPGAGRTERLPEHIADEAPDPEEQAADEDEARREMAALLGALESLRTSDPEAAEVVRRRHAMDGLGDPETLEDIAAAPLRSTGRTRCREGVRQAYERGKHALKAAAPAMLAALPADAGRSLHAGVDTHLAERVAHAPLALPRHHRQHRPDHVVDGVLGDAAHKHDSVGVLPADALRSVLVQRQQPAARRSTHNDFVDRTPRCIDAHTYHHSTPPTAEDFDAWAAGREAIQSAF